MKNQFFIIALIALISSCTVVKRVHQPGYYVSWHKQHNIIRASDDQSLVQQVNEPSLQETNNLLAENVLATSEITQNVRQSDELVNVSSNEPISVVTNQKTQPEIVPSTKEVKAFTAIKNTYEKKASNGASSGGGKSQGVALVLAILLGGIGIHRFYLGHIGMGILYLFTAGLCGIGWLIDIILIATGSLEPKDGSYDKTL